MNMTNAFGIVLAVAAGSAPLTVGPAAEAQEYVWQDAGVAAAIPKAPKVADMGKAVGIGFPWQVLSAVIEDGTSIQIDYMVPDTDALSQSFVTMADQKKAFDGNVLDESDIALNGYIGREVRIDLNGKSLVVMRSYYSQRTKRLYKVSIMTRQDSGAEARVKAFLGSFRFVP